HESEPATRNERRDPPGPLPPSQPAPPKFESHHRDHRRADRVCPRPLPPVFLPGTLRNHPRRIPSAESARRRLKRPWSSFTVQSICLLELAYSSPRTPV